MKAKATEQITINLDWDKVCGKYVISGDFIAIAYSSNSYEEAKGYAKGWIDANEDGDYFRLEDHCA